MLFIRHSIIGGVIALIVYDDVIVIGNDMEEREALRNNLAQEFEIKELGRLNYFLSIEVARSTGGIFVLQQKVCVGSFERNKDARMQAK